MSFLAARAAPSGGFWVALAGGVAMARVAERRGARLGFGASIAAMLETVAIIGPARFGVPLTQAATAPIIGRLHARHTAVGLQFAIVGLLRLIHNTATTAFFIWVIAGGLDAYAGTYDALGRRLGLDVGTADALVLTAVGLVAWCMFATVVQVLVYRRGLLAWDRVAAEGAHLAVPHVEEAETATHRSRFDPRVLSLIAALLFVALLASTAWPVLLARGGVSGDRLAVVAAGHVGAPDRAALRRSARRRRAAVRAGRRARPGRDSASRAPRRSARPRRPRGCAPRPAPRGCARCGRRMLAKARRVPSMPEAAVVLDSLGSERRLVAGARALAVSLRDVPYRPLPFLDAVLAWVVSESERPEPAAPAAASPRGAA